jgi:16S rRNA (cytosine1402-N4)-methyltransferase
MKHEPVLLNEVLDALRPASGDVIIDGTVDGGGHASAILERIVPKGKLLGVEWDSAMLAKCRERLLKKFSSDVVFFAEGNYADLPAIMERENFPKANGLLIDLGFSSEQIVDSGRGFSFSAAAAHEPLLMTYGDDREPLREILGRIEEEELADIIYELGGERYSRRIAKAIVEERRRHRIMTAGDLAGIIHGALPKKYEHGRIDPATRTFQALRIYTNGELENLKTLLASLPMILAPGGIAVIITFHSLEDKIVKNGFRDYAKSGMFELITKKPISASRVEIVQNPRSRSAKLRAVRLSERSS